MMSLTLSHENSYWNQGMKVVVGVDEVGRGSLAGPVVAAAVCFNPGHIPIKGIDDSKRVSPSKRIVLSTLIRQQARQFKVSSVSVTKINQLGISAATQQAIETCLLAINHADTALIDGVWAPRMEFPCETMVRGDAKCYSIAAASIVAKVHRDTLMKRISVQYPQYHWDKNMGYGTLLHRSMIKQHGPSVYHRRLFIRKTLLADTLFK